VSLGEPGDSGRLLRQAGECPLPGVAVQALALLGRRHRELARPKEARRIAGQLPEPYWSHRREVASVKECLEWLDRAREE